MNRGNKVMNKMYVVYEIFIKLIMRFILFVFVLSWFDNCGQETSASTDTGDGLASKGTN